MGPSYGFTQVKENESYLFHTAMVAKKEGTIYYYLFILRLTKATKPVLHILSCPTHCSLLTFIVSARVVV